MARLNSGGKIKPDMPKAKLNWENIKQTLFIFKYVKPYKTRFVLALIFLSIGSSLTLAYPYLFGQLMDIAAGNETKYFGQDINKVFITIGMLLVLGTLLSFFRITWFARVGESALADLRIALYSKILNLPMNFFANRRVGELISRITADLSQIQDTLSTFLANVLRQSITLIAGITIVLVTNIKLAGIMLLIIPFVVVFALFFGRKIRKLARDTQDKLADTGVVLEESFQGIANVKSFTNEQYETNRYKKGIKLVVELAIKNATYRGAFAASVVMFMFGAISLVMWAGIAMIQSGEMKIGELNSFIFYGMFIAGSMAGFAENYNQLQKTVGATQRVREIFDEIDERKGNESIQPELDEIAFNQVSFSYPSRKENLVLDQINFTLKKGEKLAVVGASGAGKTTLTALLLRYYQPTEGQITFGHHDIQEIDLHSYRDRIGIVPQDVILFGGTIYENILYGRPSATREEVIEAANAANAHVFIHGFNEGYDTLVGDRGIKLSGGQKQRIAIARALLKNPEILILDEATSSLDSESEKLIQDALNTLMANRTSFIIAHRLSTIKNADKIMVLDNGRIAESGTHNQLITIDNGIYQKFYQLQMQEENHQSLN